MNGNSGEISKYEMKIIKKTLSRKKPGRVEHNLIYKVKLYVFYKANISLGWNLNMYITKIIKFNQLVWSTGRVHP